MPPKVPSSVEGSAFVIPESLRVVGFIKLGKDPRADPNVPVNLEFPLKVIRIRPAGAVSIKPLLGFLRDVLVRAKRVLFRIGAVMKPNCLIAHRIIGYV